MDLGPDDLSVAAHLEAKGGALDRLDYGRLRQLSITLRLIPEPGSNWDVPPASLQGWIASYQAALETFREADRSGVLKVLVENSRILYERVSFERIPQLDADIVGPERVATTVVDARERDRLAGFDFESLSTRAPTEEQLARALTVWLNVSVKWVERPKVDEDVGRRRLRIGAILGRVAIGGALAVANLSLGVLGGLHVLPAVAPTTVPVITGLLTSAYTGFSHSLKAIEDLADELER